MAGTDRNSTLDTSLNYQKEDHSEEQNEEEQRAVIAAKESKAVLRIRVVVFIVLLLSTIAVACWIYGYIFTQVDRRFLPSIPSLMMTLTKSLMR